MGHDIYAIKTEDTKGEFPELSKKVAYLRRSCFCVDRGVIYKVLKAEKHYGGVSGNGAWQNFNKSQLNNALEKLGDSGINPNSGYFGYVDQKEFIQNCLKNLDEKEEIVIGFF